MSLIFSSSNRIKMTKPQIRYLLLVLLAKLFCMDIQQFLCCVVPMFSTDFLLQLIWRGKGGSDVNMCQA